MTEVLEILKNSIYITGLVIIMMLVIEYVNVATKGHKSEDLQNSPWKQVLLGAALGLIPGCMGGFAAVSLFSHNIISFGALAAAMISDTGDETFIMFAAMPGYALLIKALTFSLAVVAGFIIMKLTKNTNPLRFDHKLEVHSHHGHSEKASGNIWHNVKHMSFGRAAILICIFLFMLSLALGVLEHDHNHDGASTTGTEQVVESHDHDHDHDSGSESHEHEHEHGQITHDHHSHSQYDISTGRIIFSERWLNILFILVALCAFVMVLAAKEHFLKEHIIEHVVYKHLLRIFLWTFGSLLFIYLLQKFVGFDGWISENQLIMLLIAIAIGLIPESGPHIVFISLFMQGSIPFSILLANSLTQNGHSGLPLLAESKKSFVKVKLIGAGIGLLVGLAGHIIGF